MQTYILKTHINHNQKITRKIEISGDSSLYKLAQSIVSAYNFDFDHCFGFFSDTSGNYFRSKKKYELFADLEDQGVEPVDSGSVKDNKIKNVFTKKGEKMLFLFDYGDNWEFIIQLEQIAKSKAGEKYPKTLETKGRAPRQY